MVIIKAEKLRNQAFLNSFVRLSGSTHLTPAIKWQMLDALKTMNESTDRINKLVNDMVKKYETEPGKVNSDDLSADNKVKFTAENGAINEIEIEFPFDGKIKITDEIANDVSGQDLFILAELIERG